MLFSRVIEVCFCDARIFMKSRCDPTRSGQPNVGEKKQSILGNSSSTRKKGPARRKRPHAFLVRVELVKQSLRGVQGSPRCLLLRARLVCLNTRINRITYQVTVLSNATENVKPQEVDKDTEPNAK
jgi:hypothetical protein